MIGRLRKRILSKLGYVEAADVVEAHLTWAHRHITILTLGVALAGFLIACLALYTKELPQQVGIPLPGDTKPFSPGSGFDVLQFCEDRNTTVTEYPAPDASASTWVAERAGQQVAWSVNDAGNGTHFWVDSEGRQHGDIVLIEEDARACMSSEK